MNFTSDNTSGVHPAILEAIVHANHHGFKPYGADNITSKAEKMFSDLFERDLQVFFVATGTAANALSLAASVPPWGTVLCHENAHIVWDECGAPEFYAHGAKIYGLPGKNGKLDLSQLEHAINHYPAQALSLTQATESGTVYTLDEISALGDFGKRNNLTVHMDGARFANALVTLGCTPAEMTWKRGVDILSFGATKNGGLMSEAIVVFKPELAETLGARRKRAGQTVSKHWFMPAQFEAYLRNDLWLNNASHANRMATRLADELTRLGIRITWKIEANEIFCILPRTLHEKLQAQGATYYEWPHMTFAERQELAEDEVMVRLVTSFVTTEEEISGFVKQIE